MKTWYIVTIVGLCMGGIIASFQQTNVESEIRGSPEYAQSTVTKLVEVEGCFVYRFYDYSTPRYVTICPGEPKMPPAPIYE